MAMAIVWGVMVMASVVCAVAGGRMAQVSSAALEGARAAVELCISLAGVLCLWSGFMELLKQCGLERKLAALFRPLMRRLLPQASRDAETMAAVSGNLSANLLGLGNAATPMGIQAAKRLKTPGSDAASDQLCRLVVLNTASIQLLPTNVAAVRAALGCGRPFDILPAVWVTSILSAGLGVCAAMLLGRVRKA